MFILFQRLFKHPTFFDSTKAPKKEGDDLTSYHLLFVFIIIIQISTLFGRCYFVIATQRLAHLIVLKVHL